MFLGHPPDEKGPVVRQKFQFATIVVRPLGRAGLAAFFALSLGALAPRIALAQEKAPDEEKVDETRKAANISWNPKATFQEWNALNKVRFGEFDAKLKAASFTDADKKQILKHLQNQIYGLTIEQNVDRHHIIVDTITRASEAPGTSPAARDLILENTLKMAEQLIEDQPPNVQYSLVLLVARLNSKPANLGARPPVPAQPYPEIRKFLMKVVDADPPKAISVRIIAVRGLDRLMRDGDISTVNKSDIGIVLAKALGQKVDNPLARKWYRRTLVDALGATGRYEETGYRPVIIDGLMSVITNSEDAWEVRSAAARAVSQLPLDQKVNIELVNYEIVRLFYDLSNAYMASDKMPPSTWRWSFDNLYLAYKSATANEQTNKHWGLMHLASPGGRPQIEAAYKLVLKVVKPVIEQQNLPNLNRKDVDAIGDWLEKNKPASRKVTQQSPNLPEPPAAQPKAAQGQNPGGLGAAPGGK
jgi:hypothetical protein